MENIQQPSTSQGNPIRAHVRTPRVPNTPCRGLCKRKKQYDQVVNISYTILAALRNTLVDGLLLTFINTTQDDVDLIWQDYEGEEIPIIKFKPGDQHWVSAVTVHNFCCRNTETGQNYLLNTDKMLYGYKLKHKTYQMNTIRMTVPRTPQSLRELAINATAGCFEDRLAAFKLVLPYSIQAELYVARSSSEGREYYSIDGEPGTYRKSYGPRDEGPLIYPPGLDWSKFDE